MYMYFPCIPTVWFLIDVYSCVLTCVGTCGGQKRVSGPLELEMVVSSHMCQTIT